MATKPQLIIDIKKSTPSCNSESMNTTLEEIRTQSAVSEAERHFKTHPNPEIRQRFASALPDLQRSRRWDEAREVQLLAEQLERRLR